MADPPGPPRSHTDYIIQDVMPAREVHLMPGPAGVGKTSLLYQWIPEIVAGGSLWGYRVVAPTGVVFVSCDRSRPAHLRRLDSLGIPHDSVPFYCARETQDGTTSIDQIFNACLRMHPTCSLYVIDGFATLVPGNLSSYVDVSRFLVHCGQLCEKHNKTILGTLHTTKVREGESFIKPREKTLGSAAWGGFADLMLVLDEERDPATDRPEMPASVRRLDVLSRAPAGDFTLRFKLDRSRGNLYVPFEPGTAYDSELVPALESWVRAQSGRRLSTRELVQYGESLTLSARSVERWLASSVESGLLVREAKGVYSLHLVQ